MIRKLISNILSGLLGGAITGAISGAYFGATFVLLLGLDALLYFPVALLPGAAVGGFFGGAIGLFAGFIIPLIKHRIEGLGRFASAAVIPALSIPFIGKLTIASTNTIATNILLSALIYISLIWITGKVAQYCYLWLYEDEAEAQPANNGRWSTAEQYPEYNAPFGDNTVMISFGAGLISAAIVSGILTIGISLQTYSAVANSGTPAQLLIETFAFSLKNNFLYFSAPLSIFAWLITAFLLTREDLIDKAPQRGLLMGGMFGLTYPVLAFNHTAALPFSQLQDTLIITLICLLGCCAAGKISGVYIQKRLR